MRLTEFHELVTLRFGAAYGASVLVDHVLTTLDGRTGVLPQAHHRPLAELAVDLRESGLERLLAICGCGHVATS